jgi:hypothetical protein
VLLLLQPAVIVTPANSDCDHSEKISAPAGSYEYEDIPSYQSRIGIPERYQQYSMPASSPPRRPLAAEKAQIPKMSPVAYPGSRVLSAAPMLASASFDTHESSPRAVAAIPMGHDLGVLDQAVDDLFFLSEGGVPPPEVNESVMDFVTCWDPSSYGPDAALENDTQLGNLLDRLLWDEI